MGSVGVRLHPVAIRKATSLAQLTHHALPNCTFGQISVNPFLQHLGNLQIHPHGDAKHRSPMGDLSAVIEDHYW